MESAILAAAGEKNRVLSKGLPFGIRPLTRAEGLVLPLVVEFLPEEPRFRPSRSSSP
jgi:hypothetical protein